MESRSLPREGGCLAQWKGLGVSASVYAAKGDHSVPNNAMHNILWPRTSFKELTYLLLRRTGDHTISVLSYMSIFRLYSTSMDVDSKLNDIGQDPVYAVYMSHDDQ